ncbi:MAG: hypothetical protein HY303_14900 [Candidatus Wallbacteria bacterium]|nr:hypothetical protein [Candidatus Wallbacteria bacterium]
MNPAQPYHRFEYRHVLVALAILAAGAASGPALAGPLDDAEDATPTAAEVRQPQRPSAADDFDFGDLRNKGPDRQQRPPEEQPQQKPKGKVKYDRVDGGNQDGTSEARDHLAEVIGTSRVGFDRETLARASFRDLQLLKAWFDQVQHMTPDFPKNAQHAREKMKGDLSTQTNYSLYKARTKGWFDKQHDSDDFTVVASFLRFARDQQPPAPLLTNIAEHLRDLTVAAGPAYKVDIKPDEAIDPDKLAQKFERDLDKGALQFGATYLQGLMMDDKAFGVALKLSQMPDEALVYLNQPPTRSDFDTGSGRDRQQQTSDEPAEVAAARRDAQQAAAQVAQAERGMADATAGLSGGKWTRESLLDAVVKDPKIDAGKIAEAGQQLAKARKIETAARGRLAALERDARTAREGGATIARRYEQLAGVLGKQPEDVTFAGPLAKHRALIERKLQATSADALAKALFDARRDPVKMAQLVKDADRLEKAVQYQVTAEDSFGKLAKQKAALDKAAEGMKLAPNAPADLKSEVDKIKSDLGAQQPAQWEGAFWEQRNVNGIKTKADALSKDLAAIGDRMKAIASRSQALENKEKTERQINDAQAQRFREDLSNDEVQEVLFATPLAGKVKPHVKRGVTVLDRLGNRVGALPPAEKADIIGALMQSADSSNSVRAFKIKIPEKFRKSKKIEEGFVPSMHFGPVDADGLSAALASAKPAAEGTEESASATGAASPDKEKERTIAEASAQFWSRLQISSADLETGKVQYTMDLIDRTWPANNACKFKDALLKRFRDALDKWDKAIPGSVDRAAYEQLARMENTKELSSSGLEKEAADYGKVELHKLEALVKAHKETAPPSYYRWGVPMSVMEAR